MGIISLGKMYDVLPLIDNPANLGELYDKFIEICKRRLNRKLPTIKLDDFRWRFLGFQPQLDRVVICGGGRRHMTNYESFIEGLETIVDLNNPEPYLRAIETEPFG
jgi:hypothetical protein